MQISSSIAKWDSNLSILQDALDILFCQPGWWALPDRCLDQRLPTDSSCTESFSNNLGLLRPHRNPRKAPLL